MEQINKAMIGALTNGLKSKAGKVGLGIVALALAAIPALAGSGAAQADTCGGLFNQHTCLRPAPLNLQAGASWDTGYYTGHDSFAVHLQWENPSTEGLSGVPFNDVQLRVRQNGADLPGFPRSILDAVYRQPFHSDFEALVPSASLAGQGSYCFSVLDKSQDNLVSDWSREACVDPELPSLLPPGAPRSTAGDPSAPRPANLNVVVNAFTAVTLGWSYSGHAGGFVGFRLYRDGQVVGTVDAAAGDGYQYTDSGLELRHAYTYKVCTVFHDGDLTIEGLCSDPLTFHTPGALSPSTTRAQAGPLVSP